MMRRSMLRGIVLAATTMVACVPHASAATEAQATSGSGCERFALAEDGSHRESFDVVDVTGQIAGFPPRIETDVQPGEQTTLCVGFQNRTGEDITLDLETFNVGVDDAGLPQTGSEDTEFGAASWLRPRTKQVVDLPHGHVAWIDVDVRVPGDAVTGSSYASIVAKAAGPDGGGNETQVRAVPAISIQIFFDIPGNVDRGGEIRDARAPRVIWWDGLGLGDVPVLDDLRGLGIATVRFDWRNDGNVSDDISGRLVIESDLTGKDVARIEIPKRIVLRGAERSFDATWSRDIPMVGRFTPTLEITSGDGRVHKRELEPIWVIPAWWYLALLVLAIAIPIWWRRRSRQRYEELLARVEAAESRAEGAEFDGDAWDDAGDWEDGR